ncbi:DUF3885 domain-containing protein [Actinoalloteichus hymeniacidonis]|uniref:DUF3885 domain-containing protein n=1 Tax=Actinoalloteichus hymeniacidonis TaxID=340345 RepID=A0AAC9HR73_9PSEU|nr:hypothetical protein [Actinoalloteichus hymeniacidonis]AOS63948.1 hypothetical protein TL08_15695 [Actinoalloteichus hymeniacidonis]MBB5907995.1 hypothetical protein [Actinoalloteichus hymeniacidonis]
MTSATVDTAALTELWDRRWPGQSKLPYELRDARDRWVRFHALPESKRYPERESEYATVLRRHNTVLTELADGGDLLLMTSGYSDGPEQAGAAAMVPAHRDAAYWTTICIDDQPPFESYLHLFVSRIPWSPGALDPLLRQVADWAIANVVVADVDLRWLYHPYDGGMDVILGSSCARDELRERHRDWLSQRSDGM